jgi:hypothetical protein
MASLILRPTTIKHEKGGWLVHGSWGKRTYPPMSKVEFYRRLHRELIDSGILPLDSPAPSNQYHQHVTMAVMHCSWTDGRWISDG